MVELWSCSATPLIRVQLSDTEECKERDREESAEMDGGRTETEKVEGGGDETLKEWTEGYKSRYGYSWTMLTFPAFSGPFLVTTGLLLYVRLLCSVQTQRVDVLLFLRMVVEDLTWFTADCVQLSDINEEKYFPSLSFPTLNKCWPRQKVMKCRMN